MWHEFLQNVTSLQFLVDSRIYNVIQYYISKKNSNIFLQIFGSEVNLIFIPLNPSLS